MTQHHKTGAGGEGSLNRLDHGGIALGLITPQLLHRQHIDGEALAPGQFHAGTHNTGVLAVADQQPVPFGKRQTPERQHAAAGDVSVRASRWGGIPQHWARRRRVLFTSLAM